MTYHANRQLAELRYPDGAIVRYRYDTAGRPTDVEHPGGTVRYTTYQWQRVTRTELPGGLVRQEAFDALQRTTRIEVGTTTAPRSIVDHHYTYDAVGNIADKGTYAGPTTFDYDALDRLTRATPPTTSGLPNEAYTYDDIGNRKTSAHQPGAWTYNANNELTAWGEGSESTALEYDANGNLIREQRGTQTRTYRYDELDRLIEIADNGMPVARYAYDPFARRVRKEALTGTPVITWALSIDRGLLAEYDESGELERDWSWEAVGTWSTGLVAQRTRESGPLVSRSVHTDHLWTPIALTTSQGQLEWRAQHEAFGTPRVDANATASTPWRFPGQYADSETGLSHNLWRHYDQRVGRYTQSDPIGLMGGANLHSYARNSPTKFGDPNGLSPVPNWTQAPRQCWPTGGYTCCQTIQGVQCTRDCGCPGPPEEKGYWITAGAGGSGGGGPPLAGGSAKSYLLHNTSTQESCATTRTCYQIGPFAIGGALGGELGGGVGPPCGKDLGGTETCFVAEVSAVKGASGEVCFGHSSGIGGSVGVGPSAGATIAISFYRCEITVIGCVNTPCWC
jgi:RHS repeat-associated protein